ncbi:hypothetical protein H4R21_006096, partial [Coemansia helicoidea]
MELPNCTQLPTSIELPADFLATERRPSLPIFGVAGPDVASAPPLASATPVPPALDPSAYLATAATAANVFWPMDTAGLLPDISAVDVLPLPTVSQPGVGLPKLVTLDLAAQPSIPRRRSMPVISMTTSPDPPLQVCLALMSPAAAVPCQPVPAMLCPLTSWLPALSDTATTGTKRRREAHGAVPADTKRSRVADGEADKGTAKRPTKTPKPARFVCMLCGKTFARPSSLATHSLTHTGEKPHRCEFPGCGKSFSVISNMRRHQRTHDNPNPNPPRRRTQAASC